MQLRHGVVTSCNSLSHPANAGVTVGVAQLSAWAEQAGWVCGASFETMQAGPLLDLWLGTTRLPVWRVDCQDEDSPEMLAHMEGALLSAEALEHFLVVTGLSPASLLHWRDALTALPGKIVWVGAPEDFIAWLPVRLGPLAGLAPGSAVRRLVEPFMRSTTRLEPARLVPAHLSTQGSAIQSSYDLGADGVQVFCTLLQHWVGEGSFENVEDVLAWRRKDVDLLVRPEGEAASAIKVEIKTENQKRGNITLEDIANTTRGSPGWFHYSEMDVLVTYTPPLGDLLVMDFAQVKAWHARVGHTLKIATGRAPGQAYTSRIWLAPETAILAAADIPDAIHLDLRDWLPTLCPAERQTSPSAVTNSPRTIRPWWYPSTRILAAAMTGLRH